MAKVLTTENDIEIVLNNVSHVHVKYSDTGKTTVNFYDVYTLAGAKIRIEESDISLATFNAELDKV